MSQFHLIFMRVISVRSTRGTIHFCPLCIDICLYEIKFSLHTLNATSCEFAFKRNCDRDFMIDKRIDVYRMLCNAFPLRETRSKIRHLNCRNCDKIYISFNRRHNCKIYVFLFKIHSAD